MKRISAWWWALPFAALVVGILIQLIPDKPVQESFTIDFSRAEQFMVATNSLKLTRPINVNPNHAQVCNLVISNSSGQVIKVSPPPGCFEFGNWYVTNVSFFHFSKTQRTNGYGEPLD